MKPDVSIIVPIYNTEKYLEKCLDSLIHQTFQNIEIIIVDDGSPDHSSNIYEKYRQSDSRIKVIQKLNTGLSDSRNTGLSYATGNYLLFVDSDDYIDFNLIEKLYPLAKENNADVLLFGYYLDRVDTMGSLIDSTAVTCEQGVFCGETLSNILPDDSLLNLMGYAWNKLYKREFIVSHNISFEKGINLVEDILFNAEALSKLTVFVISNQPYYHYMNRMAPTLVNRFYSNSYELLVKSTLSREKILRSWHLDNSLCNKLVAKAHMNGIKFCLSNLFFIENPLSLIYKYRQVKSMLHDENTIKSIDDFTAQGLMQSVFLIVLKYRLTPLLVSIYTVRSLLVKMSLNREK